MRVSDWQVRVIQLLAVPGLLVSLYLWLFHSGSLVGVCEPSGWDDCGAVSGPGAPYASIGPIPVAAIGFAGFALIFAVTWLRDWFSAIDDYLPELLVGVTGMAVLFTLYLTGLEIFVIHAICRFCVVSALIVLLMFVLSISYLRGVASQSREHLVEAPIDAM